MKISFKVDLETFWFMLGIEAAYQIWHGKSHMLREKWFPGTRRSRAIFWNRYLLERQWFMAGHTGRRFWMHAADKGYKPWGLR